MGKVEICLRSLGEPPPSALPLERSASEALRHELKGDSNARRPIEIFNQWDSQGNGEISEEDLYKVLQALDPRYTKQDTRRVFKAADADKDGMVDFQQFLKWAMGSDE